MGTAMSGPSVPRIFSQARRAARTRRHTALAAIAAPEEQFLRIHLADEVMDRLDFMRFEPCPTLVLGDAPGVLSRLLSERGHAVTAPDWVEEEQPLPGQWPLIVSLLALDTVNDLPGALIHLRRALTPGGLLIACITGAGTLATLRQVLQEADGERPAARVHPQIDNQAASALMARAGFARQVVDSHDVPVTYRSLDRLLADLRLQGLTGVLADAPPPLTRAGLERARAAFAAKADAEGRVTETFAILTLTGWA